MVLTWRFLVWVFFRGKMGVAARWHQRVWGLENRPKIWPTGWTILVRIFIKSGYSSYWNLMTQMIIKSNTLFLTATSILVLV